jgi:hypothetical protein
MTNEVSTYLKYANLQMASEALLDTSLQFGLEKALTNGNNRSSKFTTTQATEFVNATDGWTVVEHLGNTTSGFSGTLFKNNATGELVLSFRSTEFIDDAVRDNQATNTLEIKELGWAFGQIADMEDWYAALRTKYATDFAASPGGQFAVTGYSLGGHLATAFNLLRMEHQRGQVLPFARNLRAGVKRFKRSGGRCGQCAWAKGKTLMASPRGSWHAPWHRMKCDRQVDVNGTRQLLVCAKHLQADWKCVPDCRAGGVGCGAVVSEKQKSQNRLGCAGFGIGKHSDIQAVFESQA